LKARSFDVQGALKQFKESATAHKNNHIAELYDEIEVNVFEETRSIVSLADQIVLKIHEALQN
jgi:hypothetical protein